MEDGGSPVGFKVGVGPGFREAGRVGVELKQDRSNLVVGG